MKPFDRQAALQADRHLIHPLHHPTTHGDPRFWVKGEGSTMTDIEGRTYIDGLSGLWNVVVGHGRRELVDAAAEQMSTLPYCSPYSGSANLPSVQLAERLSTLTYPRINTFFFSTGGGDANESAFKTARYYWKTRGKPDKVKVIARDHAYHGVTLAAMSATGMRNYWPMFEPRVPEFVHVRSPYPYLDEAPADGTPPGVAAANHLEEAIQREGPDTVAAFIAEPVQGAGGVIVPPEHYFQRIREICDKYDVLLIADEVITGFGRTGRWFGLEHWGVEPDILVFAKGITSGYTPLGGMGMTDAIRDSILEADPGRRWMHAFTYASHPTCCAVALANLDVIENEDLVTRAAENGAYFLNRLKSLESHPNVGEARGLGMMCAVEIVEDKATRKRFDSARKVGPRIHDETMKRGLFSRVREDAYLLAPPLVTSRSELDRMVDVLGESIQAVLGS